MPGLPPAAQTRIAVGFVVQPFVAALTAFLMYPVLYFNEYFGPDSHHVGGSMVGAATAMALVFGLATLPLIVAGALPVLALLVWRRVHIRLPHALAAGAFVGNLPLFVVLLFGNPRLDPSVWRAVAIDSLIGVACAGVFWVIAGESLASRVN